MPLSAHEAHTVLLHGMAGSVDGTALSGDFSTECPVGGRNGLVGYLRENLAPKVRLKSRGRSL